MSLETCQGDTPTFLLAHPSTMTLGDVPLEGAHSHKCLGTAITDDLKWDIDIDAIRS